jgi:hypothetical protein
MQTIRDDEDRESIDKCYEDLRALLEKTAVRAVLNIDLQEATRQARALYEYGSGLLKQIKELYIESEELYMESTYYQGGQCHICLHRGTEKELLAKIKHNNAREAALVATATIISACEEYNADATKSP